MKVFFKFTNGKVASTEEKHDLDSVLQMVKHTKYGRDQEKEFDLNVKATGETIRINHKDIKAIEIEFE